MRPVETRAHIGELLLRIGAAAGSPAEAVAVDRAHRLLEHPGPARHREIARASGLCGLVEWAADRTEAV
jgi:hypothetical protein